ncbi:hypothetical protein [Klebsiella quasipneumoniae]
MTKSTITREQLEEWVAQFDEDGGCDATDRQLEALIRQSLSALDSESWCLPLDYLHGHKDGLEWAAQLPEANHPETGDWLYDDPIELSKAIRKGPDMPPVQPVADSEPDRNPVLAYADSYRDMAKQGVESVPIWSVITDLERNIAPLYRHAQPAPVVPDELNTRTANDVMNEHLSWKDYGDAEVFCIAWNACRAAMLQAERVTTPSKLPSVIDDNLVEGLRLLQCMLDDYRERNYGHAQDWVRHIDQRFSEHSEAHGDDAYCILHRLLAGEGDSNSPAIPDGSAVAALTGIPMIPDGYVMVPKEPTDEMIAAAMNCEDVLFNSDDSFCVQFGNIYEAMLAAATQPQNAPQNIPEIIPNELIAAVNRLLDSNGSRGCYDAIKCYDARIEVERLLAAARQEVKP